MRMRESVSPGTLLGCGHAQRVCNEMLLMLLWKRHFIMPVMTWSCEIYLKCFLHNDPSVQQYLQKIIQGHDKSLNLLSCTCQEMYTQVSLRHLKVKATQVLY